MKTNRSFNKIQKDLRAGSSKQPNFSLAKKFSTLEVIFLASLPIDAAIWYAHVQPVAPTAIVEKAVPARIEIIHPVFKPESIMEAVIEKKLEPVFKTVQQPVAKTVAVPKIEVAAEPTIEELIKKEAMINQENWGEDLVEWNRQANEKVKESMDKYATQNKLASPKAQRVVGRMAYAFQDGVYFQRSPANAVSANAVLANDTGQLRAQINVFTPTKVGISNDKNQVPNFYRTTSKSSGGGCSLRPPVTPDPRCRANYACRICGGCCCMCEARLAGL